jgi:hypothetical protein
VVSLSRSLSLSFNLARNEGRKKKSDWAKRDAVRVYFAHLHHKLKDVLGDQRGRLAVLLVDVLAHDLDRLAERFERVLVQVGHGDAGGELCCGFFVGVVF